MERHYQSKHYKTTLLITQIKIMPQQIKKLLYIIKHGSKEEISEAKKEFERIWPYCRVDSAPEEFMKQDECIQTLLTSYPLSKKSRKKRINSLLLLCLNICLEPLL